MRIEFKYKFWKWKQIPANYYIHLLAKKTQLYFAATAIVLPWLQKQCNLTSFTSVVTCRWFGGIFLENCIFAKWVSILISLYKTSEIINSNNRTQFSVVSKLPWFISINLFCSKWHFYQLKIKSLSWWIC